MKSNIGLIIIIVAIVVVITIVATICVTNVSKRKDGDKKITEKSDSEKKSVITKKENNVKSAEGINVVPTMLDTVTKDSIWCGTFQLIWNDVKKEIVKQDIIFNPSITIAENLNKESFTQDMISSEYYYKKYGVKTLELKKEIEKGIKEKFNQESDILDEFDWEKEALDSEGNRFFFYAMLYRKFEYLREFDKLKGGTFGKLKNVKYFGIVNETSELVDNQMKVLYYKSKDDFAIKVNTKSGDEVIFHKNPVGNTFKSIYENMNVLEKEYRGSKSFDSKDTFKAPYMKFKEKREYNEIEGKDFITKDNQIATIEKALQVIQFSIDEKGGEVKSEAGMDVMLKALPPKDEKPRIFEVDNTFVLFLREQGELMPYFAARVDDISKYQ